MRQPEKNCPYCKGPIDWTVVRTALGAPFCNGLCKVCNAIFRGRETPDLAKGRERVQSGELPKNIKAMDDRITRHPTDVQLGILRELQHGKDGFLTATGRVRK